MPGYRLRGSTRRHDPEPQCRRSDDVQRPVGEQCRPLDGAAVEDRPVVALETLERRASSINSDARVLARHAAVVDEHGGISGSADDVLAGRERDVTLADDDAEDAGVIRRRPKWGDIQDAADERVSVAV